MSKFFLSIVVDLWINCGTSTNVKMDLTETPLCQWVIFNYVSNIPSRHSGRLSLNKSIVKNMRKLCPGRRIKCPPPINLNCFSKTSE